MHPLLIDLELEHRNLRRLLHYLVREIDRLEDAIDTSIRNIRLAVEYLELQPERTHQVNERHIEVELLSCAGEHGDRLQAVQLDHGVFGKVLQGLGTALRDHPRSKRLRNDLRAFVDRYQRHLVIEEEYFIPAAAELLDGKAWSRIEDLWVAHPDPVFGPSTSRRFHPLALALHQL